MQYLFGERVMLQVDAAYKFDGAKIFIESEYYKLVNIKRGSNNYYCIKINNWFPVVFSGFLYIWSIAALLSAIYVDSADIVLAYISPLVFFASKFYIYIISPKRIKILPSESMTFVERCRAS